MSNKNQKVVSASFEEAGATGDVPTKVVQLEQTGRTVSQSLELAGIFTKAAKQLESLYSRREEFNEKFFGTGHNDPSELEEVLLVPDGASGYREGDCFSIKNPETLGKIRALVSMELTERIEVLENQIVNFTL